MKVLQDGCCQHLKLTSSMRRTRPQSRLKPRAGRDAMPSQVMLGEMNLHPFSAGPVSSPKLPGSAARALRSLGGSHAMHASHFRRKLLEIWGSSCMRTGNTSWIAMLLVLLLNWSYRAGGRSFMTAPAAIR